MGKAIPITVYFSATKEDSDLLEIIKQYPSGQSSYMLKYLARIGAASLMATGQLNPPPTTTPIPKAPRKPRAIKPKLDEPQSQNVDQKVADTDLLAPIPAPPRLPRENLQPVAKIISGGDSHNPPPTDEEVEEFKRLTGGMISDYMP